jgi:thiol-disulfide isomerase/thioredoxin
MKRRGWVLGGAAALAAGVGGVALQQWQASRRETERAAALSALEGETGGFWQLRFPQPDGGELATATLLGQPLLLNFWGTWCPPCIQEMPELERFAREFAGQGWRVLGLAVDNPKAVREYLARSPVSYAIALAGFEGGELSRKLGNSGSGLPFTVSFGADGRVRRRKAGATTLDELRTWA